jgi:hypothetical protein
MVPMSGNRKSAAERREIASSGNSGGSVANLRPWQKGQSGNPAGRPKGIAATVRDATDPVSLVGILLDVANDPRAKASERIAAVRELLDRGYGKAPAFAAIEGTDPLELSGIALEIQQIADELAARRASRG